MSDNDTGANEIIYGLSSAAIGFMLAGPAGLFAGVAGVSLADPVAEFTGIDFE